MMLKKTLTYREPSTRQTQECLKFWASGSVGKVAAIGAYHDLEGSIEG